MFFYNVFKFKKKLKERNNRIKIKNDLTIEEKNEIIKHLPKFKYHPNLYTSPNCVSIVKFENSVCQCCEREVNAYIENMYSKEDINCICLNCVANGAAAKKFDGSFINNAQKINNPKATDELNNRTPGYYSWQGEYWLACCNDYCEFVGNVGIKELNEMGIAEQVFEEYEKEYGCEDIEWIKNNLMATGAVAGYLFRCKKCGKYRLYVDMS